MNAKRSGSGQHRVVPHSAQDFVGFGLIVIDALAISPTMGCEVERHDERVGHQQHQQDEGRTDEDRPQDGLAVEPSAHARGQRTGTIQWNLVGSDRHALATLTPFSYARG